MKYKIVWKKFHWQKIGRFWLYYYHPATSDWRYTNLSKYFEVRDIVNYEEGRNKQFRIERELARHK